jgi:transcription-repair coupling factor (superfamily II helicase)
MDVYRRLSASTTFAELNGFEEELRDRFGPVPPQAANLISLRELQLLAHGWGIRAIRLEEGYAVFQYADPQRIRALAGRRPGELRIVDRRSAYLVLQDSPETGRGLVDHLKSVLR